MCRRLLILTLITGALLISTEGQQSYHSLPDAYKNTVNQAIEQLNKHANQHMNFVGFLQNSENANKYYIEFHLKATQCTKTEQNTHRDECEFMKRRPNINCAVCIEHVQNQLSNRYIHCVPQLQANKVADLRFSNCSTHDIGGISLIGQMEMDAPPECLGCL